MSAERGGLLLVTGSSGFIGGRLTSRLASLGLPVRATSRRSPARVPDGAEFLPADIGDRDSLSRLLDGVRCVVNVAGQLGDPGAKVRDHIRANVEGPLNLIEEAATSGCERFVHVSTVGLLGGTGPRPAPEDAPPRPVSLYERTKWQGEVAVLEAGRRLAMPVTVIRPALVYGPGDRHLLPLFRAVRSPFCVLIGGGRAMTHPVHVDDVVEALRITALSPEPVEGVYHIAGERPVSFRELLAGIAAAVGVRPPRLSVPSGAAHLAAAAAEIAFRPFGLKPPLTRQQVSALTTDRVFDISRARQRLGWRPLVSLEEGLALTVEWYRAHDLL